MTPANDKLHFKIPCSLTLAGGCVLLLLFIFFLAEIQKYNFADGEKMESDRNSTIDKNSKFLDSLNYKLYQKNTRFENKIF